MKKTTSADQAFKSKLANKNEQRAALDQAASKFIKDIKSKQGKS